MLRHVQQVLRRECMAEWLLVSSAIQGQSFFPELGAHSFGVLQPMALSDIDHSTWRSVRIQALPQVSVLLILPKIGHIVAFGCPRSIIFSPVTHVDCFQGPGSSISWCANDVDAFLFWHCLKSGFFFTRGCRYKTKTVFLKEVQSNNLGRTCRDVVGRSTRSRSENSPQQASSARDRPCQTGF